ncbi:MAG: Ldh family oxidoreductase [Burkholderiales bacterium]|nr:Ldh family oxidoreductase [Burkholderiales bacterium]
MSPSTSRYAAAALTDFAQTLYSAYGMRDDIAAVSARVLVEGDLLGHSTHGLALLPGYLKALDDGSLTASGEPTVENARTVTELWHGHRLSGTWLTARAVERAATMARTHGTGTISIKHAHHIACLAAYLEAPAREGLLVIVQSSDPCTASVAPHGGITPIMTPNPIAVGIPAGSNPIMIDISSSITANGPSQRMMKEGKRAPGIWYVDHEGHGSTDPAVAFTDPKGALLPLGGLDAGHKGFGLGLMIEAMTGGLAGFGRADPPEGWGATVFVQVIDPAAFGGIVAFTRQVDQLRTLAHASAPRPGVERVRLPGEGGLARKAKHLREGVALHASIMPALTPLATARGVAAPSPLP